MNFFRMAFTDRQHCASVACLDGLIAMPPQDLDAQFGPKGSRCQASWGNAPFPSKLKSMTTDRSSVAVQYSLPASLPEWELPEVPVPVPESPEHDEMADRLKSVLVAWQNRTSRAGAVRRNLAIRWDEVHPRVGVDPDVCWLDSVPPGFHEGEVDSLRLWLPGHVVPPLAIEIVSRSHPYKVTHGFKTSTPWSA